MSEMSFGNIILAKSGKKGILKPNADGVYRLNAGGFNLPNANGIVYPANQYIIDQMDKNSDLSRRVSQGYCLMEVEHPEPFVFVEENGIRYKRPMTSVVEWITRLRGYDDRNVCGLISKIIFRPENPNNLRLPIWNFIDCEPYGDRKDVLRESLENPRSNTAVSIRTQISPFRPGETQKNVEYWTGYDKVNEPGMPWANKHATAGCESFLDGFGLGVDNVQKFKVSDVIEQLGHALACANADDAVALARVGGLEALEDMRSILEGVKRNYKSGDTASIGVGFTSIF